MRLAEKILPLVTLVILGAGTLCYTMNLDIYRSVENMNPAGGYAEFVNKLGDGVRCLQLQLMGGLTVVDPA